MIIGGIIASDEYWSKAADHLVLAPSSATIMFGGSQAFTATLFDAYNTALGDVTKATTFTVDGSTPCPAATCSPTTVGDHTVTATDGIAAGTTILHVVANHTAYAWGSNGNGQLVCGEADPDNYNNGWNGGGWGGNGGGNNWGGGRLPGGSWGASCRDARMSGPVLYARCDNGDGRWYPTQLDMRQCYTNRARNNYGNLLCE